MTTLAIDFAGLKMNGADGLRAVARDLGIATRGIKKSELVAAVTAAALAAPNYGSLDPKDKVLVSLEARRSTVLKDKSMTLKEAMEADEVLNAMYEATGRDGTGWDSSSKFEDLASIDERIQDLQQEKKDLEKELGPAIKGAKKLGILKHYSDGGDNMVEVYFKHPNGTEYRIIGGDLESA